MTTKKVTEHSQDELRSQIMRIEFFFEFLRTVLSIVIALGIVLVIVAFITDDPLKAIQTLLMGPLKSIRVFGNVIELAIPLTFCGLAITVIFSSNRFNMAADGAFFVGGLAGACAALAVPDAPFMVKLFVGLSAGFGTGMIIGLIPALLNRFFGAWELITSLMMNYAYGFFVRYVLNRVIRNKDSISIESHPFNVDMGKLFTGTRIHYGLIIVLVLAVLVYVFMYKTRWGYALRVTGKSEKYATYSGIKTGIVILGAQVMGAAIAGLGGAVEMFGLYQTFRWTASQGYGFDGIIISTLARNNPLFVPISAFFLSYLRIGADVLNRSSDIPAELMSAIQAVIILLIAAKAFLSGYKQKAIVKQSQKFAAQGGEAE